MKNSRSKRRGAMRTPKHNVAGNLVTSKSSGKFPNPRSVSTDLVCPTRKEVLITWSGPPTAVGTLSAKQIVDSFPGTSTIWDKVQFHSFDFYGVATSSVSTTGGFADWPAISVTLNSSAVTGFAASDRPTFYSDAVANSRRAHVHIVPNLLFKESWVDAGNTEPLFALTTTGSGNISTTTFRMLMQATVVLRSTAGTSPTLYQESVVTSVDRFAVAPPQEFVVTVGNTPLPVKVVVLEDPDEQCDTLPAVL